jgi:hypothetical protein
MNKCKLVNIVWVDRGIFLSILYIIIMKYNVLLKKIIIIENSKYITILKILFPKLKFKKNDMKNNNKYFYFNIRKIIKQQDIIIDYLNNYDNYINTNKLSVVPWYDMNDVLVIYEYDDNKKFNINKYKLFLNEFNKCKRGDYNGIIWDMYMEKKILNKYHIFNSSYTVNDLFNLINKYIGKYTNTQQNKYIYIPTVIYKEKEVPKIVYKDNEVSVTEKIIDEDNLNELISIIRNEFNLMENIIK